MNAMAPDAPLLQGRQGARGILIAILTVRGTHLPLHHIMQRLSVMDWLHGFSGDMYQRRAVEACRGLQSVA